MVGKLKPADIDSNVWFHVTEGRVDKPGQKFSSMLQVDTQSEKLKVSSLPTPLQYWQFQPVRDAGQYVVRNSRGGPYQHLSSCYNPDERADVRTGVCMRPADGDDDAQVWLIDRWGSSWAGDGLRFVNAANGTGLWLDVRKDNSTPFMSGDNDDDLSQHWYMASVTPVNAVEYSTIYKGPPPATSMTTTASSGAATVYSSGGGGGGGGGGDRGSSDGLSTGVKAGIGAGIVLAVLALAIAVMFLWRRRRRYTSHGATSAAAVGGTAAQARSAEDGNSSSSIMAPMNERFRGSPEGYAGGYQHISHEPQELSCGETPSHNARHELDAMTVSRETILTKI